MKKLILVANFIIFGIIFLYSIIQKEDIISNAQQVILKLAPVDPRSLMQGDYMRLNFKLARDIRYKIEGKKNLTLKKAVVTLNSQNIATLKSIYSNQKLEPNEIIINFKYKFGRVVIITDAWFFQEGEAKKFEKAKYGEFRINKNGVGLLIGVLDKNLDRIE